VATRTVQHSGAGGSSNINRGARARSLLRSVPGHDAGVCERCAGGKTRGNLNPELYVDGLPGLQRTIRCGVVRGQYRAYDRDTGRCAVHGRRWGVHKREATCTRAADIVSDYDRGGRARGGIGHVHQVVKLSARHGSTAAHHADLLGNCQACDHYNDDLSEVPPLKAEKRVTIWCNAAIAEIDDPTVRVKYCVVNSRGTITVRVRCD